jgi:hypothetical protein
MIKQDELAPHRSRRRIFYYPASAEASGKLGYPIGMFVLISGLIRHHELFADPLQVGKWIKDEFGTRSRVTAVFMTHAVINDNSQARSS